MRVKRVVRVLFWEVGMEIILKSLNIAIRAYAGKVDKAGSEYIKHPLRIMAKMKTDAEMSVALLHDVIEDSEITADELLSEGIPTDVVDAIICLTKIDNESYHDFIVRVRSNELAVKIKIADIEDNINVLRLKSLSDTDLNRVEKYHSAWRYLTECEG